MPFHHTPFADDAAVCAVLRDVVAYCTSRQDTSDLDTVREQRYRIAAINAAKAMEHLAGQRDAQIAEAMQRSQENLAAFARWCQVTGRTQVVYLPNRDYPRLLREALAAKGGAEPQAREEDDV